QARELLDLLGGLEDATHLLPHILQEETRLSQMLAHMPLTVDEAPPPSADAIVHGSAQVLEAAVDRFGGLTRGGRLRQNSVQTRRAFPKALGQEPQSCPGGQQNDCQKRKRPDEGHLLRITGGRTNDV